MPASARPTVYKKTSVPTQEKILDAAEILFSENGFASTSLRAIADLANVNLAAPNYHFVSKEGLLAATVHRRVDPINEARISKLDLLESGPTPLLPAVIRAFLEPLIDGQLNENLPRLMARIYAESATITRPLIQQVFGGVSERYIAAIARVLPDVEENELRWRFHFVIGAMLHILKFPSPAGISEPKNRKEIIARLERFVIAGLTQDNTPAIQEKTS